MWKGFAEQDAREERHRASCRSKRGGGCLRVVS
jgi:hypothetical protein